MQLTLPTLPSMSNKAGAHFLRQSMVILCLAMIALQAGDAISTHVALATGLAEEKNQLLLAITHALAWPIMQTVFVAKILTAALFALAIIKAKPSLGSLLSLGGIVMYFVYIVSTNFHWANTLAN